HRDLARRLAAVRRRAVLVVPPNASVHIQGEPTGAAWTFMMRPTTAPSASTSKSSSLHSPDGRDAEVRLGTRTLPSRPRASTRAHSSPALAARAIYHAI